MSEKYSVMQLLLIDCKNKRAQLERELAEARECLKEAGLGATSLARAIIDAGVYDATEERRTTNEPR
jgi:hypothetical protein